MNYSGLKLLVCNNRLDNLPLNTIEAILSSLNLTFITSFKRDISNTVMVYSNNTKPFTLEFSYNLLTGLCNSFLFCDKTWSDIEAY